MPDLIQFDCPACSATLRIPIEMSGHQAPCPVCHHEIVAPNPYTGVGAYSPQPPPPPRPVPRHHPSPPPVHPPSASEPEIDEPAFADPLPEPIANPAPAEKLTPAEPPLPEAASPPANQPFADRIVSNPPAATEPIDPAALPSFTTREKTPPLLRPARKSRAGAFLAIFLLLILIAAATGLFITNHFKNAIPSGPLVVQPPPAGNPPPSPPEENIAATPPDTSAAPPAAAVPPPPVESEPQPKKILATAEGTLRAFLESPDWKARSVFVLSPDHVRPKMEAYARNNPDGPTAFRSFSVKHSEVDPDSGSTLLIFQVEPSGDGAVIPVAVLETEDGWRIDWESFVEFRDDHFKQFTDGPSDLKGEFHLIVTLPDDVSPDVHENEKFAGYVLAPPLPERRRIAFIEKSNPAYQQLREATANGKIFTPVLELTKQDVGGGKSFLKILSIRATNWWPQP